MEQFKQICFQIFFCLVFGLQPAHARIGHFWHITDLHLDNNYTRDGDPNHMCWTTSKGTHMDTNQLGKYGDYNCDAPISLVTSAVNAMKSIFPDPDFIIWTGDDTAHVNDSFFSTDIVVDVISELTQIIMDTFNDTYVLPVLGNHDLFPQNQIPAGPSILQTKVAELWKPWLTPFSATDDFEQDGRYTADIPGTSITVIGINTLLWYQSNKITADDPNASDPGGQFAWLDTTIRNLSNLGRKIYLMGHIPPGSFERYFDKPEGFHWYQPRYNIQYIDLIKKHGSKITAQFFGHHHTDAFRVFLSDDTESPTPLAYLLIAPAVTPMRSTLSEETGANNPGVRLISYDTESGMILEVSTYYLDLSAANQFEIDNWKLEYNLTTILDLSEISHNSLYDATLRMKEKPFLFDGYYPVNTVQWENTTACSSLCRTVQICAITEIDYDAFYHCNGAWKPFASVLGMTLIAVILINLINRWIL